MWEKCDKMDVLIIGRLERERNEKEKGENRDKN